MQQMAGRSPALPQRDRRKCRERKPLGNYHINDIASLLKDVGKGSEQVGFGSEFTDQRRPKRKMSGS
jgi:hypothetical protein